jgi:hypothetical protein
VEVLSGGHTLVIDDFRSLTVDGATAWSGAQDKGHNALVAAFADALARGGVVTPTEAFLASSRATLSALSSTLDGRTADLEHL